MRSKDHTRPYLETNTLSVATCANTVLPDAILDSLPGRRLSSLVETDFVALKLVNPVIDSIWKQHELSGPAIDIEFAMEWVTVALGSD